MTRELHREPCVVNCCLCLRAEATTYGGHVTRGRRRLLAGWCAACRERLDGSCSKRLRAVVDVTWTIAEFLRCDLAGWCGHWLPAMGSTTFGEREAYWAATRAAREEASP